MTKEQFYIDTIDGGESVLTDNGKKLSLNETCNLLNELTEENRKMKGGIYPVDIDIISNALVTSFAKGYVTLVELDQELERMGFSETNMQRIKIQNKMKRHFESMLFEFIHWSRIEGVF